MDRKPLDLLLIPLMHKTVDDLEVLDKKYLHFWRKITLLLKFLTTLEAMIVFVLMLEVTSRE